MQSIKQVHEALLRSVDNNQFSNLDGDELEQTANRCIDSFAQSNDLTAHTISPLRWRFNSEQHGEISDGVIEFHPNDGAFTCVDVSDAKLVDSDVV